MKPAPFNYYRATSLDDALNLMARLGPEAKLLAGGQSLMPAMNLRLATPSALVDISRLPDLVGICHDGNELRIGAATRYGDLLADPAVPQLALLVAALPHVANSAVRNRGTLGGSLCHADPSAETAGVLLALGAELGIANHGGRRRVSMDAFLRGVYETALEFGDILEAIYVPLPTPSWHWFGEHVRRRGDFAIAGLAACGEVSPDGRLSSIRFSFFGLGARARLATATMERLEGEIIGEKLRKEVVDRLEDDLVSTDPEFGADSYRMALAVGLLDAALHAVEATKGKMELTE